MAKKVITRTVVTDDFDGKEIDEGFAEEFSFSFDGKDYRIDLRPDNAEKLRKDFSKWIDSASEVSSSRRGRSSSSSSSGRSTKSGRSKEELAAIRAWAKSNNHEVSGRGRIKSEIIEAFDKAHK